MIEPGVYAVRDNHDLHIMKNIDKSKYNYIGVAVVTNIYVVVVPLNYETEGTVDTGTIYTLSRRRLSKFVTRTIAFIPDLYNRYYKTDEELPDDYKVENTFEDWEDGALADHYGYASSKKVLRDKNLYVPAMGELATVRLYIEQVNDMLEELGGIKLENTVYGTSSPYDKNYVWCINPITGETCIRRRDEKIRIRLMLKAI